jgi:hypothetical protein
MIKDYFMNMDIIKQTKFKKACAIYSEVGEEFGLNELEFTPVHPAQPWVNAPQGIEDFVNDKITEDELRRIARTLIENMEKAVQES